MAYATMTEEFLHYVWRYRLFDMVDLKTAEGEDLQVIKTGDYNTHAGADFFNAKIMIGNTLWAGNVEIHLQTNDWNKHRHQHDGAYNNVILHVVHDAGMEVQTQSNRAVPLLELKGKIKRKIWDNYEEMLANNDWIPCQKQLHAVDAATLDSWLEKMVFERLERKTYDLLQGLNQNRNNWEETFYVNLAKNFGYKINSLPFELLAKSVSNLILAKHKDKPLQLEALLFGQAGMLNKDFKDDYYLKLRSEYEFLKHKYSLQPIDENMWKFMRLRPIGFPTIRISQFADLIHHSSHLFSKILVAEHVKDLEKLFDAHTSDYWQEHYTFDKPSIKQEKRIGKDFIHNIIINTIVPFLYVYGKKLNIKKQTDKALELMKQLPKENNSILDKWSEIGIDAKDSFQSQALLELKNEYCFRKKCLTCAVGNKILSRDE